MNCIAIVKNTGRAIYDEGYEKKKIIITEYTLIIQDMLNNKNGYILYINIYSDGRVQVPIRATVGVQANDRTLAEKNYQKNFLKRLQII